MTDEDRKRADHLQQQALCLTDHPDKAVSLLTVAGMTILQRRYVAEKAIGYLIAGLDCAGAAVSKAIYDTH